MLDQINTHETHQSDGKDWIARELEAQQLTSQSTNSMVEKTAAASDTSKKHDSPGELSEKIAGRFDTANISAALSEAMNKGVPLFVQIGEKWCPHCQRMASNVLPALEGSIDKSGKPVKGELQGKAIFLHLDFDQSKTLSGPDAQLAEQLRQNVEGFPTFRVYNIDKKGNVNQAGETSGEMSKEELEKFLQSVGIKK